MTAHEVFYETVSAISLSQEALEVLVEVCRFADMFKAGDISEAHFVCQLGILLARIDFGARSDARLT